jgi:hypothetical protein
VKAKIYFYPAGAAAGQYAPVYPVSPALFAFFAAVPAVFILWAVPSCRLDFARGIAQKTAR